MIPVVNREDIDWAELRTAAVAIGIRKAPRQAALDHVYQPRRKRESRHHASGCNAPRIR